MSQTPLKLLFCCIFLCLFVCSVWASIHQGLFAWGGLKGTDRYWTIATLMDAYFGFLTFYLWVVYKEPKPWARVVWFVLIMGLGNIAMSLFVLIQLMRLGPNEPAETLLWSRNK